jgi:hypothetical protein
MAKLAKCIVVAVLLAASGPASAQLRGGLPGVVGGALPGLPPVELPNVRSALPQTLEALDPRGLADLRLRRLTDLVRANAKVLDADAAGNPVVRGEVLATSPSAQALAAAQKAGFTVTRRETLEGLDLELVTLTPPARMDAREAVKRLKRLDPQGRYDFNHLYFGAGGQGAGAGGNASAGAALRVGLIDTGLDDHHPALAGVLIERRGFSGPYSAAVHGLAVASLTGVGNGGALYSADVYGPGPAGGSAEAVAKGLAWMVKVGAPVVNVSLVGPANGVVQATVEAVQRKGVLIVAPVGNDGPAAPAAYPASYPGVIAVTAVDRKGRVLLEAGRASHLDFAAPGADIAAAQPTGMGAVRGTSFASPIVAGRLAALVKSGSRDPVADLARQAKQPGRQYGKGLVGSEMLAGR